MTPANMQSSGEKLMAPSSWECQDVFIETPSRNVESTIKVGQSNPGPWLPSPEELRSSDKSKAVDIDAQLQALDAADDHSLNVSDCCNHESYDVLLLLSSSHISLIICRHHFPFLMCCLPMTMLPPNQ